MTNLDPQTTAEFWDAYVNAVNGTPPRRDTAAKVMTRRCSAPVLGQVVPRTMAQHAKIDTMTAIDYIAPWIAVAAKGVLGKRDI